MEGYELFDKAVKYADAHFPDASPNGKVAVVNAYVCGATEATTHEWHTMPENPLTVIANKDIFPVMLLNDTTYKAFLAVNAAKFLEASAVGEYTHWLNIPHPF